MPTNGQIWRPYTQEKTTAASVHLSTASGAYLYSSSGQKIFDGISSWWLITHGHCHPSIVAAVQAQAAKLDQVTFANFTHEPAEELAELLREIVPTTLSRIFFSDNGSTAVEVAIKMAIQSCAQTDRKNRTRILTFAGAYHGDTVGAMSVSGASVFNDPYKSMLFDVVRARHPTDSNAPVDEWIDDFRERMQSDSETLAAVIIEPLVQGAGGMIFWPAEAIRLIVEICRQNDVLVIFDEVMTGFGRTGHMFAFEKIGVVPDLLCLSKGLTGGTLPLAVTLATEKIFDAFSSRQKNRLFFHGHSFTGNPISCAAAVANLKIFQTEDVAAKLNSIESIHRRKLHELASKIRVSDPRICGTIAALEVGDGDYGDNPLAPLQELALQNGIFIRPMGNTFYLMPTYDSAPVLAEKWETLVELFVKLGLGA